MQALFLLGASTILSIFSKEGGGVIQKLSGKSLLLEKLSFDHTLTPFLWFLIALQIILTAFEFNKNLTERLKPLLKPIASSTFITAIFLWGGAVYEGLYLFDATHFQYILLIVLLLLSARYQQSVAMVAAAVIVSYIHLNANLLSAFSIKCLPDKIFMLWEQ